MSGFPYKLSSGKEEVLLLFVFHLTPDTSWACNKVSQLGFSLLTVLKRRGKEEALTEGHWTEQMAEGAIIQAPPLNDFS